MAFAAVFTIRHLLARPAPAARLASALPLLLLASVPAPVDAELLVTLADRRITESSGLAASRRLPGVLWTHNDSGDGAFLYATDRAGRALATVAVAGAANVDWEDLALGPGPDGDDALYVADSGDNARTRDDLDLYRVPEPSVPSEGTTTGAGPVIVAAAERHPFSYPDGRHDAETLLVHPATGETLIVTKEPSDPARVYRFPMPLQPEEPTTLVPIAAITLPGPLPPARVATGGTVSADGTKVMIRTPLGAVEWTVGPEESLAKALAREPRRVALPLTPRGEAIAYRADGAALVLTSEGAPCPLYEVPL